MKRLLKSWVFWAFVALPIAGALSFGVLWHRSSLYCACGATREERVWWVGIPDGPGFTVLHGRSGDTSSTLLREILGTSHAHAWCVSSYESRSLWKRYQAHSNLRVATRNVADVYHREPAFRAWLKEKVESGEIAPAVVEADLVSTPYHPAGQYPFGWTPP